MSDLVERLIERYERLKADRRTWDDHWERLAELMLPRARGFTTAFVPGERRNEERYDSVPMLAARSLASSIDGLLKPKTSRWFEIKTEDEDLNELDPVKEWLSIAGERMRRAIYGRRARFQQSSGETDLDLVVFGSGVVFTGTTRDLGSLLFRAMPLANSYIVRNGDGIVDTIFLREMLTPAQAAHRWGQDALSREMQEALTATSAKNRDAPMEIVSAVLPREDRDITRRDNRNMPFASLVMDAKAKHLIEETGFHEFPYATPLWDSASGEDYGRSPGMLALPDANTLMAMTKTLLIAGQRVVDPPLQAPNEGISILRTHPGAVTFFDIEVARELGGRPVINPLDTGGNVPVGREMQNDTREQIWAAFFRNVLQLPIEGPQMTATEILERKEEFIRTIGPVFGRLEADYVGPIVERVFSIMLRLGRFPDPPRELMEQEIKFEFASPVERVRKQLEAAASIRVAEIMGPYIQADPALLDNVDGDEMFRDVAEAHGWPQRWIRDRTDVEDARERRDQAAQAQAQLEALERGGKVVKDVGSVIPPEAVQAA